MEDLRIAYERLRSPENRLYLGLGVGLLAMTLMVGCLVLYQVIRGAQTTSPQLVFAPKDLGTIPAEPTLSDPTSLPSDSDISTQPVAKKVVKAPTAKAKPTAKKKATGQSCIYSSPRLNQVYSPAPSGSWSPIQRFFCDNGYWDIGKEDVVDRKTGGWGQDGVVEKVLIKYDSDGNIAGRIFIDPDGDQFSGPQH